MALATQCPHCHTTFRVAHDQLKLRSGLVRCGSCKEIFNGIEHLLPSETVAATRTPAPVETPAASSSAPYSAQYSAPFPASAMPAPNAAAEQTAQAAAPKPEPAPTAKPAASDQLDFAYPEMGEDKLDPIPDTVLEPRTNDPDSVDGEPVEVAFIETPRKTPLATPAIVDPEPAHPLHGEPAPHTPASPSPAEDEPPADPLTRMTLIDVEEQGEAASAPDPNAPDPLDKVMEDFERRPARGVRRKGGKPYARSPIVAMQEEVPRAEPTLDEPVAQEAAPPEPAPAVYSDAEEPEFIKRERHKRTRGRAVGIAMNTAAFLMLFLAIGQGAYIFRDQLAARVPETRPALQSFCALLDCKVGFPTQIATISFDGEQFEMLSTRKDTGEFSVTLRNTGNVTQTWPQLELTLNDDNKVPLTRRVFAPQEYLPAGTDPKKGFAANSEQPVKLYFEFADAKPAGFLVGVFYP